MPDEVLKEFYVHGVSVDRGQPRPAATWSYKQDSTFNRRIHTLTEMILAGPARGHAATDHASSRTDGTRTRGTVNNCANGYTPWGTYLTCEENWAGYFRRIVADRQSQPQRRRRSPPSTATASPGTGRELWATVTPDTARQPLRPLERR